MDAFLWILWPILIVGAIFYLGGLVFAIASRSKSIVSDLAKLSDTVAANAPKPTEVTAAVANTGAQYGALLMQRSKLKAARSKQKAKRQRRLIGRIKGIEIEEGRFR